MQYMCIESKVKVECVQGLCSKRSIACYIPYYYASTLLSILMMLAYSAKGCIIIIVDISNRWVWLKNILQVIN